MKKLIYGGLILTILGSGFISCKKQKLDNNSKPIHEKSNFEPKNDELVSEIEYDGETIFFEYYLNNEKMINPKYDLGHIDFTNIIEGSIDSISEEKKVVINSFTVESEYHDFIDNKGYELRKVDSFELLISNYLNDNPFSEDEYNNDEDLRDRYLNFQDSLYNDIFGAYPKAPTAIHDSYYGGSSWVMFSPVVPFITPGWNNRTSAFNNLNIFTFVHLYNKWLYRHRMASFVGFHGWQRIPFLGGLSFLNNRTSSVIH